MCENRKNAKKRGKVKSIVISAKILLIDIKLRWREVFTEFIYSLVLHNNQQKMKTRGEVKSFVISTYTYIF